MSFDRVRLDRRRFLVLGGATAITAACSSGDDAASTTLRPTAPADLTSPSSTATATEATDPTSPTTDAGSDATADDAAEADDGELTPFTPAQFESLGVCALLAETTAGPFPTQNHIERRDVTEGYPGHPLRLGLRVIDDACNPIPGAVVEIWHTDATGDYSEYTDDGRGKDEGEGSTFMRGNQRAGPDGIVEFHTIYPGWYRGRAVHIHLRVHIDGDLLLTSQLFFDDEYTALVYTEAPYAEFGDPDTTNERDGIAGPAMPTGGLLTLTPGPTAGGDGTVGLTNLGVAV